MSIKNSPATDIHLPRKTSDSNRIDAQVAYFVTEKIVFIGKSQFFLFRSGFYLRKRSIYRSNDIVNGQKSAFVSC